MLILHTVGPPLKPTVDMLPGQEIELTVNNFTMFMRCLSYNMNFNYTWEKKNEKLSLNVQGVNSQQLTITNLKSEDSGEYRCIMSNSTGKIAADYLLLTVKGLWLYNYVAKHNFNVCILSSIVPNTFY